MAVGTYSEGTSEEVGMTTIQEHLMSAWKTAESDVTTNPARRETVDEKKEECVAATVVPLTEGKPLVYCT